ncbi:Peptidoglycan/LPS O-acetylase OafA/YrhL, contains acyltransferase and SGNH-hydrolase domains [Sinosporangium album]|uniref:Peptidoglycan/LPS O-acetylase OafA/YrhL, contains acyltransferase and SGNH-hydrolase domains n=1 Tax=Sinosporangium album TaxID=504805 RepID=A0A1G7R9B3_9ACTN|nr:acyltransferase family protein [Sinosporangium album]SDG07368.1 Peptidoglycan/LPS O-acetylase OafA/YrhL, contains acyltransferase and SGNH-hydrolase domains [Sinosporangium album]
MRFRPDIEGLRAVAVLAVLAFHATVPGLTGGFVGVDVFFVISGFLITGLLLRDVAERGRFSLVDFYARRARRLLPAAGIVLIATAFAAWLVLPPLRAPEVAGDVIAAALYLANWRFVAAQTDYLAAESAPSPLQHYWSLAVEEQFYLLWAPLLLVVALAARRFAVPAIAAATVAMTGGSFALSTVWTEINGPLAYLASPTRAWQFGVGALAAVALHYSARYTRHDTGRRESRTAPAVRLAGAALGLAGASAVVWSVAAFDSSTRYPGLAALVPTLGTAALILFRSPVSTLLSTRVPRAIGRLSFSWYLWHWPVLVIAEAATGPLAWPWRVALMALSALPAYLTYALVENPVRFSRVVAELPRRGLAVGSAAMTLPVAAALLLSGGAVQSAASPAQAAVARQSATLDPGAAQADYPLSRGCEIELTAVTSPPCLFGNPASKDRIVLIGDSHAGQWFAMAEHIAVRRGWALEVLTKPGCPLATLTVTDPRLGREYRECNTWRDYAFDRLAKGPVPRLILMASLNTYTSDRNALATGWDSTLARLRALGPPLAYLRGTPVPGLDIPECLSAKPLAQCAFPRRVGLPPDPLAEGIDDKRWPGMSTVDVTDLLCPGTGPACPAALNGVVLYRDNAHITNTLAVRLASRIERDLEELDLIPAVL